MPVETLHPIEKTRANLALSPVKGLPVLYESGSHTWREARYKEVIARFHKGDVSVHHWNPHIARRVRTYSPHVIGVDSAGFSNSVAERWTWLPGSPRELTGRDDFYLVEGDLLYEQLRFSSTAVCLAYEDLQPALSTVDYDTMMTYALDATKECVLTGAVGAACTIDAFQSRKEPLTRRNVFERVVIAATAAVANTATVGRVAPVIQSYTETPVYSEILQAIADMTRLRFTDSSWLNGRTALLLAKTLDAVDRLPLPKGAEGSILEGFPHAYEATQLARSKSKRREVIRQYAKDIIEQVTPIVKATPQVGNDVEQAVREAVVMHTALTSITKVHEPEVHRINGPDKIIPVVREAFESIGTYFNAEVLEALEYLNATPEWIK